MALLTAPDYHAFVPVAVLALARDVRDVGWEVSDRELLNDISPEQYEEFRSIVAKEYETPYVVFTQKLRIQEPDIHARRLSIATACGRAFEAVAWNQSGFLNDESLCRSGLAMSAMGMCGKRTLFPEVYADKVDEAFSDCSNGVMIGDFHKVKEALIPTWPDELQHFNRELVERVAKTQAFWCQKPQPR